MNKELVLLLKFPPCLIADFLHYNNKTEHLLFKTHIDSCKSKIIEWLTNFFEVWNPE